MEQFVGSNYPVFISKHIQESFTETSDYKDGVLHGLMSDFPYGRILLVAETGATAPGELPGEMYDAVPPKQQYTIRYDTIVVDI